MEDSGENTTIKCNNPYCLKKIRKMEEELSRLRSVGFDMLKQRGSWQATGVKPEELGLEFNSFFTHEIEDMSERIAKKSAMTNDEARQILNNTFQEQYQSCKETILNRMRDALSRVLVLPEVHEDDEELYDISRAYGLLLNTSGVLKPLDHQVNGVKEIDHQINCQKVSSSQDIQEEINDLEKEMSKLSWKLLSIVPPLISATILDAPYCKEWHEKECDPEWNRDLTKYQLIYYRPILFYSYEDVEGKYKSKENLESRLYKKPSLRIQGTSCTEDSYGVPSSLQESEIHSKPLTEKAELLHRVKEDGDHNNKQVFGIRDNIFYK